ncbi:hypothetical protein Psuf_049000 [Phytohabitans suffuscus]|uniref:Uncharacterized protein n=1 Tax=Phytohabitans suffuscus TaxID=624315 RepID=A0A6F8YNA5_9ACTN|nr:hypothetical protein [Phytohabitans suffuscus]BCB87587.1 hypothetical protein Psuf_049000 [Phytohabitans suffuscus]
MATGLGAGMAARGAGAWAEAAWTNPPAERLAAPASMSHPEAGSTGWTIRCAGAPPVTTRLSTARYAVNRHSTPKRSEVSTIRRSSPARSLSRPDAYRSSWSRRLALAQIAVSAVLPPGSAPALTVHSRPSRVVPRSVRSPAAAPR